MFLHWERDPIETTWHTLHGGQILMPQLTWIMVRITLLSWLRVAITVDLDAAPSEPTIAENLLLAHGNGAVGLIWPYTMSQVTFNTPFLVQCLNSLFKRGIRRLGNLGASAVRIQSAAAGSHSSTI